MAKKHSTVTQTTERTLVPWLAATGRLAYTPKDPPADKYPFQYGWLFPNAFKDNTGHKYFGEYRSFLGGSLSKGTFLNKFWGHVGSSQKREIFVTEGRRLDDGFEAPIACYDLCDSNDYDSGYLLIQQGSYQLIRRDEQPSLEDKQVVLYRGIGNADKFNLSVINCSTIANVRQKYWSALEASFSDSETAFRVAHTFVRRSETGCLSDDLSWYDLAELHGLDTEASPDKDLVRFHSQSFSLAKYIARNKFGPNYVKFCLFTRIYGRRLAEVNLQGYDITPILWS